MLDVLASIDASRVKQVLNSMLLQRSGFRNRVLMPWHTQSQGDCAQFLPS